MNATNKYSFSLRNRLVIQLVLLASFLSIIMFLGIRYLIGETVTATQDGLLNAAIASVENNIRNEKNDIFVDLPYETFSILGSVGEDKVFYRIDNNNIFLTGYSDLPKAKKYGTSREPFFQTIEFKGEKIRVAAIEKVLSINGRETNLRVMIGQTKNLQNTILSNVTNNMLIIVSVFFLLAIFLAFFSINAALRPVKLLAKVVSKRGPQDLRKVEYPTPKELAPLVKSLNGFIIRLKTTLRQTETFISEAAHHIKTPLATVKAESELALYNSKTPENRVHLKNIIRSVDQTSRSSAQLLEHALVLYRAEKIDKTECNIKQILSKIIQNYEPTANLRDIKINFIFIPEKEITIFFDQVLFELAVRNLLDNAIKYSQDESDVNVTGEIVNKHKLIINIKNISKFKSNENLNQLTKRFQRGKNSNNIVGTGLGLSIVLESIQILGGKFNIKKNTKGEVCASLEFSSV